MSLKDLEKMIRSESGHSSDRPIIVVVDDDALVRSSLETVLQDKYDVRSCSNGLEGVRTVDDNTSCVILDVRMPTHDGFWVCKHLRRRAPDVPIIFYSAYQDVKDPYEIINEYHPYGYVVKGDTLASLLSLVANAVRHSERLRDGRRTVERLRDAREQLRDLHTDRPSVGPSDPPASGSFRPSSPPSAGPPSRPSSVPPAPTTGRPSKGPTR
jgi:DNA-binding NtrC family response regulator